MATAIIKLALPGVHGLLYVLTLKVKTGGGLEYITGPRLTDRDFS